MGKSVKSVSFFVNNRIIDKLLFARWAHGKPIKENRPGFWQHIKNIKIYIYIYIHTHTPKHTLTHPYTPTRTHTQKHHTHTYTHTSHTHTRAKNGINKNGNFRLFAANGKRKQHTYRSCAPNGNGKWMFVFLGRQTIISNWFLLFQQTCPSILSLYRYKSEWCEWCKELVSGSGGQVTFEK